MCPQNSILSLQMSHFLVLALKLKLCSLDTTFSKLLWCSSVDEPVIIISSIMLWTPVIPCSTWSMPLYHTAGADETQYMSLLKRNNPLFVSMVRYLCWPSSISICRCAFLRSTFVNCSSPESFENISSTQGSGYWSTLIHWFDVPLKSPHIRTELSIFGTTTIGVANSLCSSGSRIPKSRSLSTADVSEVLV